MKLRAWGSAIRDAIRSMTQSTLMSLASVATVAVSLLVLGVVLILALNLEHAASSVEQQVEIKAYLCSKDDNTPNCNKQELTASQKQSLLEQVQKITSVQQVTFVSKEDALAKMKQEFGDQKDLLDDLGGENPLRDSFNVKIVDPNQVKAISAAIVSLPGVGDINYGKDFVDNLLAVTRAVRLGGVGLVLMLIIATVLTISNTIRLAVYARRREISIMKLVGATDWYIRRPFMMEGIFLGVFGAVLSMLLTAAGYQRLVGYLIKNVPFLPVLDPKTLLLDMTLGLVVLGGVLGALGSLLSMRRFLKV